MFDVSNHAVPAKTNPLGVKGCGEAGCAGSLTSIMNAVTDALSDYGIRHIDMPATPYRVWQAIQASGGARPSCPTTPRAAPTRMTSRASRSRPASSRT